MPEDIPVAEQQGRLTVQPAQPGQPGQPTVPPAGGVTSTDEPDSSYRRWENLYAVVFVAVLALVGVTAGSADRVSIACSAIALMAPWYFLLGRRQILSAEYRASARSVTYLAGIVVLFGIAVWAAPNTWFLAVALLPQCSQLLPGWWCLIPALTMTALGASSVGYWDHGAAGLATAVTLFVAISAFAFASGGDIGRIISRSQRRAELIAQLEATRAELAEVSREAGALAERQRLAADIHDTLAQGFSSILMLIQAADAQLEQSGAETATARAQLELAAQTARDNLAEARTLVGGLAPAVLQAGTLEDALRRITQRAGAELGITASFDSDGAGRQLPAATEVVLLRTGQEALANVRKHAAARSVAVRLCYAADRVRLEVSDDGAGFDPALVNGGYGLSGMRARVDEAGGTVAVRSAPAQGTSVLVEVPA